MGTVLNVITNLAQVASTRDYTLSFRKIMYSPCFGKFRACFMLRRMMEKVEFRSLFSLFLLFSAVFLVTLVYWFVQRNHSTRHSTIQIQAITLGKTPTSPINTTAAAIGEALADRVDSLSKHHSIDLQLFKSWKQGVVTLLEPEIPRNCAALFAGVNQTEINRVTEANRNWNSSEYDQKFANLFLDSEGCEEIRAEFDGNFYTSDEELSFPLAFSINVHSDPQQVVRFLKFIYRPHNAYCIHYDRKSNSELKQVINTLAKCLPNVIIPKKIMNIIYGCYPILDAQLSCISDLLQLRRRFPWRYVTTLCGRELPLRTNREIVHFLQGMDGRPVMYTKQFSSQDYSQKVHFTSIDAEKNMCKSTSKVQTNPVPYGMKLLKTMAYFSLTPEFTNFVVHSSEAKALYKFVKPIRSPEEAFYGTLLHTWINSKSCLILAQLCEMVRALILLMLLTCMTLSLYDLLHHACVNVEYTPV